MGGWPNITWYKLLGLATVSRMALIWSCLNARAGGEGPSYDGLGTHTLVKACLEFLRGEKGTQNLWL